MSKKFVFSINQLVVYPGQGVGTITSIIEKEIDNEIIDYYVIYLPESDMTVLVPEAKAETLRIRTIVEEKVIKEILAFLSEPFEPAPTDWKARYQLNMELFKSGNIKDTATVVRALYHRSKQKELPIQERKLYDAAYRIFQDEIIASLGITQQEAEALIHSSLEPFKGKGASKSDQKDYDEFEDNETGGEYKDIEDEDIYNDTDNDDDDDSDDDDDF